MADDRRDDRLAELLGVEPLDELTRRRLVSRALEEVPPQHRRRDPWRLLAAAAAVVIVLLGGLAWLVTRADTGGSGSERAASEALADDASRSTVAPAAPDAAAGGDGAPLARVADVGDVGDVSAPGSRRRVLDALDDLTSTDFSTGPGDASANRDAETTSSAFAVLTCPELATVGTPVGYASGSLDDRPVVVVVLERPDGSRAVRAVPDGTCEVRELR